MSQYSSNMYQSNENKDIIFPYPNQTQKQRQEENQTNYYQHINKPGEYSSKPFVNYYKKELYPVNQKSENNVYKNNETQTSQNQNYNKYAQPSLSILDAPVEKITNDQTKYHFQNQYQQYEYHMMYISSQKIK